VPCKNTTPPAVSLVVAVTGAKAGFVSVQNGSADLHGYSVMRNAMKHVYPVIYRGPVKDLDLRGEKLRKAVAEHCDKFCSGHGTWWAERYDEDDDQPVLDLMNVTKYPSDSIPVNGWFQHPRIMDWWDLFKNSYDLAAKHKAQWQARLAHQHECERKESLLHQVMTAEDLNPAPKVESEISTPEIPTVSGQEAKKSFSNWTIDLDQYLGKCDNWADEVEDEDETSLPVSVTEPADKSPTVGIEPSAMNEHEKDTELDLEPISMMTTDLVVMPEPSAESTLVDDEKLADDDEKIIELSSSPNAPHTGLEYASVTPSEADTSVVGSPVVGLTAEGLEDEDRELYGDTPFVSNELEGILRRLHESGLISRNDDIGSSSKSPEQGVDGTKLASILPSDSALSQGSFCLPIREKPAPQQDDAQTIPAKVPHITSLATFSTTFSLPIREKPTAPLVGLQTSSATNFDTTSLATSPTTFSLPIRAKLPGATNLPGKAVENHSDSSDDENEDMCASKSVSDDTTSNNTSIQPSSPLSTNDSTDLKEENETDANEKMSPIQYPKLNNVVLPLRPRNLHAHCLTDSPSARSKTTSEAWPEAKALDDDHKGSLKSTAASESEPLVLPTESSESAIVSPGQMMRKFKQVTMTPSKKLPAIPRSKSFSDLKALAGQRDPRPITTRSSSLPDPPKMQKVAESAKPKPNARSNVDKLDAISEEDEAEAGIEASLKENNEPSIPTAAIMVCANSVDGLDEVTAGVSSSSEDGDLDTQHEMMCQSNLVSNPSEASTVDDLSTEPAKATPLHNCDTIFSNDEGGPTEPTAFTQPATSKLLNDNPFLGGNPSSIIASSTTAIDSTPPSSYSSSSSSSPSSPSSTTSTISTQPTSTTSALFKPTNIHTPPASSAGTQKGTGKATWTMKLRQKLTVINGGGERAEAGPKANTPSSSPSPPPSSSSAKVSPPAFAKSARNFMRATLEAFALVGVAAGGGGF